VRGIFVYAAGDGSLWRQDAQTDAPVSLVDRAKDSIAQLPSFSPDGKRVAYSALLFLPDGNLRGDVRVIDTDGKHVQTMLEADANDVVYLYPRFGQDGRLLITRAEKTQTIDERAWLEWVNVGGDGKRTRVMDDARVVAPVMNAAHWVFTWFFNVTYGTKLRDPFTMYKVFRRECIQGVEFVADRFDFDWELAGKLVRLGYRPIEIGVEYEARTYHHGKKVRFFRDPPTWIAACVRFRFCSLPDQEGIASRRQGGGHAARLHDGLLSEQPRDAMDG